MDSRTRWFYLVALVIVAGSIAAAAYKVHAPPVGSDHSRGTHDEWIGFVYPVPANLMHHEIVGAYPTLNECLQAVRAETARGGRYSYGTYECGLNCGDRDTAGTVSCERSIGNER